MNTPVTGSGYAPTGFLADDEQGGNQQGEPPSMLSPLVIEQVAQLYGLKVPTVRRWVTEGKLPRPHRYGRRLLWHEHEILEHRQQLEAAAAEGVAL